MRDKSDKRAEFVWFFRTEYESVLRTAYLVLHDRGRAEDVTQEAFVVLYERWGRVSRYDRPDAWVRKVALRLALRHMRRDRLRPQLERKQAERDRQPAEPSDSGVLELIGRLPRAQRIAVVLFYFEDRPTSDIAELLGCSESTARVHLHKARKRLTTLMDSEVLDAG